jgi:glutaminyl-peptide cyclotransferase
LNDHNLDAKNMNKSFFPFFIIFFLFVTYFSCSNKPKRSRKPVSSIAIFPKAKNYIYGNTISVNVKTKVKNGKIDKINLYYNDSLLKQTSQIDFTLENIEVKAVGKNTLSVTASKKDGVKNSRVLFFNAVSDVKPDKLKYSVINDYPHNKKFYTQGLVFYDDYLYEGTGVKGSSGIYKINLPTGKVLMQHLIDKKYFGEGITILNDKIYQLTYQAQKGFIYDLNNFSIIDSFIYRSNEGWGLTNDGQNLIMSNGTNELIWLDPSDFSEIKKIQTANDKGIVNYLNELEYIDKKIYANVYTTNLIIIIDPQTGKVLSEINLEGIINMYKNFSDTIDYLNGIAYDNKKDRLFVTGKLWPRLFEIELK